MLLTANISKNPDVRNVKPTITECTIPEERKGTTLIEQIKAQNQALRCHDQGLFSF